MAAGWKLADAYHLPATVTGHVRIGKDSDETTLPNPAEGRATAGSGVIDEALLTVSAGAQGTVTQETCAICQNGELTQTQNTDDSEN